MKHLLSFMPFALVTACSSSTESQISRYCDTQCAKRAECSLLGPTTEAECASSCKSQANAGGGSCTPSDTAVDNCVDALTAAECSSLMSGVPAACQNLCPASAEDAGPSAAMDASTPQLVAACAELDTCCASLAMVGACNQIVLANQASACSGALDNYRQGGQCGGFPDAGSGSPDATSGSPDATGFLDASSGMGCADLAQCCTQLSGANRTSCDTVVGTGNAQACTNTLAAFVGGGQCT